LRRRGEVARVRRDHQQLGRRDVEHARRAEIDLAVGLVVVEELGRQHGVPRQPARLAMSTRSETLPFESVAIV
jgi:hypothetical protein